MIEKLLINDQSINDQWSLIISRWSPWCGSSHLCEPLLLGDRPDHYSHFGCIHKCIHRCIHKYTNLYTNVHTNTNLGDRPAARLGKEGEEASGELLSKQCFAMMIMTMLIKERKEGCNNNDDWDKMVMTRITITVNANNDMQATHPWEE